jgi:hypothetical protein
MPAERGWCDGGEVENSDGPAGLGLGIFSEIDDDVAVV